MINFNDFCLAIVSFFAETINSAKSNNFYNTLPIIVNAIKKTKTGNSDSFFPAEYVTLKRKDS